MLQTIPTDHANPKRPIQARRGLRTTIVVPPFSSVARPSIQAGLLCAIAREHGLAHETLHLNLELAARIGVHTYERIASVRGMQLGDWLFSPAAFGAEAPDPGARFFDSCGDVLFAQFGEPDEAREAVKARLLSIRDQDVPRFLSEVAARPGWDDVDVVGFTCTFQQTVSALALARALKARRPELITVFGGANFDGVMGEELVRRFACIDYAISGEADRAYPELLQRLRDGRSLDGIPGLLRRDSAGVLRVQPAAEPLRALDELPVPEYGEYFDRIDALRLLTDTREVFVPFESSRGCWWGQKHHCTFCGLNATTMRFRAKTPERVRGELATLAERHGTFRFEAVDNIMSPAYLDGVFGKLTSESVDYQVFYEVKSNLEREHVRDLARGGIVRLQPGIESLSTEVLKLMRKGVTGIQNINLLRWCRYYGIEVSWNVLWGFPGELPEHYLRQAETFDRLHHLTPPKGTGRVWLERFSPLFTEGDEHGVRDRRPEASYEHVFPAKVDRERVAYFFEYEIPGVLSGDGLRALQDGVARWEAAWAVDEKPSLVFRSSPGRLQIEDRRDPSAPGRFEFGGELGRIYARCSDRVGTPESLRRDLELTESVEEIREALDAFVAHGLMVSEGRRYLSLALPATPNR